MLKHIGYSLAAAGLIFGATLITMMAVIDGGGLLAGGLAMTIFM